ncbi:MAG TPA: hypothetical protein VFB60_14110 [Ktedonobacteraceae bacterium]|nr:hypothetical protein [Ktedonobacteraceae bacterium]
MKASSESGYSLFFIEWSRSRMASIMVALILVALGIAAFVWALRFSGDASPDSITGYSFAISGTFFMLLAAVRYALYRRSRKRAVGKLNGSLHWHMAFGSIGLVLLCLHSFGNLNPRSGTYALWGMIALVISGIIGRTIDHFTPRKIAKAASRALTAQGEDRVESLTQNLQSIVVHNKQEIRTFKPDNNPRSMVDSSFGTPLPWAGANRQASPAGNAKDRGVLQTSWDMAYISLEETPQEISRDAVQYRFVPDRKSALARPGALLPGAYDHINELQQVEKALRHEQYLRYVVRYWRSFHILLAIVTVGLTLWHLEFAMTLLIPVWLHH